MREMVAKVLSFTKVEHTIFSVPLLFAGAWLGAGRHWPAWSTLAWIVLAGVGARALGMAMNRIFDRHIDAQNPRTAHRELPTGALSQSAAIGIAASGLLLYVGAAAALGPLVLALSPLPAAVLIGYSLLKRFTPLCHFGIGAVLGLAPVGAFVAARGALALQADILLLGAFAFFWLSGFDIIYALQDLEFDRTHGVHSLPALLGRGGAELAAGAVHVLALLALFLLVGETNGGLVGYAIFVLATGAFASGYLPFVPLPVRFFPISAIAGIAGAIVPLVGR